MNAENIFLRAPRPRWPRPRVSIPVNAVPMGSSWLPRLSAGLSLLCWVLVWA